MRKRNIQIFLTILMAAALFTGCSDSDSSTVDETPDTTEQVVDDEVQDYSVLSYKELEVLAYEGDVEAEYMLAQMLEYGNGDVEQDFEEAYNWYKEASDAGNADATCALGYFYLNGIYVEQDLDQATELFNTAIEAGSINANVGLGRTILAGLDLTDTTDEDAIDDTTDDSSDDSTEDVEKESDLATVYSLFSTAADASDLDGMYYLGFLYENGYGVTADLDNALSYYVQVADSGSTDIDDQLAINMANTEIALIYIEEIEAAESESTEESDEADDTEDTEEDTIDIEDVTERLTTASDNGYAKASYYLGQIYENGIEVDKDYEKAMEYYLVAADSDFAPALNQIGYMYYNGLGVDVDFASAVYYQKLAALQGYAKAQVNLGFLYENGYGVERNLETALEYYEMAAEADYEGAMEAVVRVKAQINEESKN